MCRLWESSKEQSVVLRRRSLGARKCTHIPAEKLQMDHEEVFVACRKWATNGEIVD